MSGEEATSDERNNSKLWENERKRGREQRLVADRLAIGQLFRSTKHKIEPKERNDKKSKR